MSILRDGTLPQGLDITPCPVTNWARVDLLEEEEKLNGWLSRSAVGFLQGGERRGQRGVVVSLQGLEMTNGNL